jgi:hypothetical protein
MTSMSTVHSLQPYSTPMHDQLTMITLTVVSPECDDLQMVSMCLSTVFEYSVECMLY